MIIKYQENYNKEALNHLLFLAFSKSQCVMTAGHLLLLLLQLLLSAVKFYDFVF